ncbi:hypothetical protein [Hyphomicrobium sp.]|uniref:hypothetical protein n=1 Tax=Hyphomicrobium sp. TaxID=82 RepID=UPI0025B7F07D|nr:hypothetical protein [Hyphomicrobium sp.]MCC7250842.1 hypothetical protein [Hyphomicrobium sp.]
MLFQLLARGVMTLAIVAAFAGPSDAGWLSRLVREAGESGGGVTSKLGKTGASALDSAAAHVASLPKLPGGGTALAAHVTPEGHWKFANREGQVFTAGTPDELARVGAALAPEAAPGGKLAYYLSEDTVFNQRTALKDLPQGADLHLVVGKDAYRLRRTGTSGDLAAEFRPSVVVSLADRGLFEETVYRLTRPLSRSSIRVLALETGGPTRLSSVPRYDPATKAALVDAVDPSVLPQALSGLKGQTALVSGRIDGNVLTFRPSSGPEQTLDVARLVKAAEDADVNLVLLATGAAHQPGGRNWLWQRVAVSGLDDALTRATFADFLSALGGAGNELTIKASPGSYGRVVFSASPSPSATAPLTDWIRWDDWVGEITGHVAMKSAEVFARDAAQERELDARIVPGIPSGVQYFYLGSLVAGLLAWQVSFPWWSRIWPPEQRHEYAGRIGYIAARTARFVACVLVFLPLVGIPALLWLGVLQIWGLIIAPFRFLGWLRNRLIPRRA